MDVSNGGRIGRHPRSKSMDIRLRYYEQCNRYSTISGYSHTGITSKTMDHILRSGRWRTLSHCRVFCSAGLRSTDHCLVATKLHLHLKRLIAALPHTQQTVDNDKLYTPHYIHQYSFEVSNKFAALNTPEVSTDLNHLTLRLTGTQPAIKLSKRPAGETSIKTEDSGLTV